MVTALAFPGQGVELPWVSSDVLAAPEVAELLDVASGATGVDVPRVLRRGGRELARTDVLQPALVAVCLGLHRLLERAGVDAELVLGHSLGELTAWSAGGGIAARDAIAVAALRGRLMAREAARRPGGMLRVHGRRQACDRAVALGSGAGAIAIAAHNADDEWIVSGDAAAIARVAAAMPSTRLPVAGAWHSAAMAGAVDELRAALRDLPRQPLRARLITNRTGEIADDAQLPALLADQLTHPIAWVAALRTLAAAGAARIWVVGPGKILRNLIERTPGAHRVEIIDSMAAIATAARTTHEMA